jgi:pyrroline-5-carboxylate reductase
MKEFNIAILGGGNIGTSLAKGLIASKQFTADELLITEKRDARIAHLKKLGFRVSPDNSQAVKLAEIIVMFAVKPQHSPPSLTKSRKT